HTRFSRDWSSDVCSSDLYAIGVARRPVSDGVMGPFTKLGSPILTSNDAWSGPGHGSVVRGPNGDWVFVYHSWVAGHVGDSPGREIGRASGRERGEVAVAA